MQDVRVQAAWLWGMGCGIEVGVQDVGVQGTYGLVRCRVHNTEEM